MSNPLYKRKGCQVVCQKSRPHFEVGVKTTLPRCFEVVTSQEGIKRLPRGCKEPEDVKSLSRGCQEGVNRVLGVCQEGVKNMY